MAERDNWLQESYNAGTTTFVVKQRNRDYLRIVKIAGATILGGFVLSALLISPGGGISIFGYLLLAFVMFFGFITAIMCVVIALMSMSLRAKVSFAISPDKLLLIDKVKDNYPSTIDRHQVASLYIDGPKDSGQVASSRVIVGPTAYVAAQAAAHSIGDISSSIGRGMGAALAASRYCLTINAQAKTINLTNALSQSEAEYLMHRVEAAWAR